MRVLLVGLTLAVSATAAAAPIVTAPAELLLGDPLGVTVAGLRPTSTVRIHALRRATIPAADQVPARNVVVHAWADFKADRDGQVRLAEATPSAGTYSKPDPVGLLWSGWPIGSPQLGSMNEKGLGVDTLTDNRTLLLATEVDGVRRQAARIMLSPAASNLRFVELTVEHDGVSGVLALPPSTGRRPAIIQLHGSEGGSMAGARTRAGVLASRGYPVLALNYVAYRYGAAIPGVPDTFVNLPVELLQKARDALASRPEVDPNRIALVGGSKGAELALVSATRLPWVKAVVACVPSDVVWAGFGRAAAPGEELSSWSWQGRPLPSIAYDRYEDVFSGKATAAEVHRRSRAQAPAALLAASRIPAERIRAPVLLLGSGKDEVWQSAAMSSTVAATLRRARGSRSVDLALFPEAGHGICGTGTGLARALGDDQAATVSAAGTAFRRTLAFLQRVLR